MRHWERLVLLAAVVAATAAVTSTAGFSSALADRGVQVAVVADDAAYLGFEQRVSNITNGTTNLTVTVTNRFPPGTSLTTVAVTVDGETVDLAADGSLAAGEADEATFESVPCADPLTVDASGSDVDVSLERTVECD